MGASNQGQNRTFYKLKTEKETNIPLFHKQKKDTNGAWVTDETFNQITGYLKKIEPDSYVWEGDTIETLKLIFEDDVDGAAFQVETGLNYLSRSILNSLAGADKINLVKIRVYTTKAKDGSTKMFPAAYLEINTQKADWKYRPDEIPKAREVKVGGKTLKDVSEVDAFFKALIPEINSKIVSEFEVEAEIKSQPQNGAKERTDFAGRKIEEPIDDLPFLSPYFQRIPSMINRRSWYALNKN